MEQITGNVVEYVPDEIIIVWHSISEIYKAMDIANLQMVSGK